jgi:hypothetical protein
MEAPPDALNPHVHDPLFASPTALRVAKDITFGSVRRMVSSTGPSTSPTTDLAGRWHSVQSLRTSL